MYGVCDGVRVKKCEGFEHEPEDESENEGVADLR